ncbi:polyketide synthase [Mycobacterium sp. ACS4054]|uniref:sulfolipid-1 biosynthesis phthioceranic/hydroxyphthioceranic acid synthase n=1 Tax=Mycobacterium sp. ACS4054 TaxID=1834119 RepID=UPI0007FE8D4B|nr:type I polyketide synthase [Mycobacterium sp. ACS4054]OBF13446.1 polyketide synthase [Mycobacterium sp. ACS4054]
MELAGATSTAVIGMACRLPGGIDSPERLWEALLRGDDLVTEVPPERWDAEEYYDPQPGVPGRSVTKWGAFLDDVAGFDCDFFGITEREAVAIDPQHRLLLETSWEAMEHAGLTRETVAGSLTGVFVGLTHGDYQLLAADAHAVEGPYGFSGSSFSLASGRIAYALGVHGPAMTVDTACSSGLTAVHLACQSLGNGESDLALAGGATVILDPRKFVAGSAEGMLSPSGRCHAFDVAADGFVSAEGCVVVLLKRLSDALRDGDRVLAVIRGSAANQDGHTVNIATPSVAAQTAVYRAALAAAGVDAGSIGMVETHGTGTPVGDPVEYASLAAVYGADGPCALGAVKTNLGHAQAAAGPIGLMKAILAVQHGVVPKNLHFTNLPDEMAAIDTNLFVPQSITPWPDIGRHPRRAAVSSYGLSGTNAHVIVEQAPEPLADQIVSPEPVAAAPLVFPLSSSSAGELRRTAGRLADWLAAREDVKLPDLAYTLARRRAHRPVRGAVIAGGRPELIEALREMAAGDSPCQAATGQDDRGAVWVFSGQGSQWDRMGAELLTAEPVFAATVAAAEPLIAHESGFSVTEALAGSQPVTGIDRVQPTLFTMQVALAATLRAHGAHPGAVIGHSLGEVAAADAAGALSLQDGARVICRRSRLMSRIAGAGAMASVELPAQQVLSELVARGVDDAVVAVVASPQSTVIGGATQTVRDMVAAWELQDVMAREIAVDVASHSPQVDPILDDLADALAELRPMPPDVPFFSATLYDARERPVCDAEYWVQNLRQMVRFAPAVRAALEEGYRVFAELAPHPLLTHAIEQTARSLEMPLAALAAMRRGQPMPHGLRGFVAELHSAGAAVDFAVLSPSGRLVDAPLPTWTHRRLLLGRGEREPSTRGGTIAVHPLLGAHVRLLEEPEHHVWQAEVGTAAQPWLGDHQIRDVAVLPAAAYCEMALAAARTVLGDPAEVHDLRFEQALLLDEQTTVSASATVSSPGTVAFAVETKQQGPHATAVLRAAADERPSTRDVPALLAAHPCREDGAEVRARLDRRGLRYGQAFSGLITLHTGEQETETVLAEVTLPGQIRSQQQAYGVHPALLDACFQSIAAHPRVQALGQDVLALPLGIGRIRSHGAAKTARYCYTRVTRADTSGVEADLDILDGDGVTLLTLQGLRLGTGASAAEHHDRLLAQRLLSIEWRQRDLPEAQYANAGTWLLVNTASDLGLTDALKRAGGQCITMCWPPGADHVAAATELRDQLRRGGFSGMVVLAGSRTDATDDESPRVGCESVQHLVRITREFADFPAALPRLYVVTRNAQTVVAGDVANLEQAGLRGLVRVIGTENPHLRATQIDVDQTTDPEHLARQLLSGSDEDETAWREDTWYTARLSPAPLRPEERRTSVADLGQDGMRLQIGAAGDLGSMELVSCERVSPGPGQIEVAVSASGINYHDLPAALNGDPRRPPGTDFAGVVTAVGPGVAGPKVGDRVGGLCDGGCWGTFVTCDARLAVTLPAGLSDEAAAAVPTSHAVAYHGLHQLARMKAGDRVLIHSATGGVGQAAIAMARAAGAEVFATAGSEARRELLRDNGIDRVYDSRDTAFAELIRRDTDGYGVDIVLNSAPGAVQRAGIELLAPGGRFIDISGHEARLSQFPARNLAFHSVDVKLLAASQPDHVHALLTTVYRLIADGALPTPSSTHCPLAEADSALRMMQSARHIGKLVLDVPHSGMRRVVVPPAQVPVFRRDGAYLITGGLGGLGLFLAEKMAAAGCGCIVLCSRSQPTQDQLETIERIRTSGTDVAVECGDIAQPGTAQRLVAAATATGLPVRGVLHAAGVVEDATLGNITDDLVERGWTPKVYGAWHLHTATAGQPVDWYCSFSSAAALVGSPGQGAYAAANSWLDAFTHWRRAQGLPATTIAWGPWAQIGRATALAESSDLAIHPDEGAYAFEALLRHDRAYTGYAPVTGSPWLQLVAERSPFAEAFRSAGNPTGTSKLRAELDGLPLDEWPTSLRRLISDQVSLILRRSVDPDRPLSGYGMDSLGALELRTRIESETGVRIPSADISTITIRGLAALLCEKLAPAEVA